MRSVFVFVLLGVFVQGTALASADELRAKRLFTAGSLAYERGRYADAVQAFEASYRDYPDPLIAFSLAQAHRRQFFVDDDPAHVARAIDLYRRYLEAPGVKTRADEAADQIQALEALRPAVVTPPPPPPPPRTEVMLYSDAPGARASIDGGAAIELPRIVEVAAGSHRVEVEAPGFRTATMKIEAFDARLTPIAAELVERPARVMLATDDGAEVFVDGERRGTAPLGPIELPSGPHSIAVLDDGTSGWAQTFTLSRDEALNVKAPLAPTDQRCAANVTLVGAGVLGVAAGVTGALALIAQSTARDLEDRRGVDNLSPGELDDLNAAVGRRDGWRTATVVVGSAAIVAGIVGAALYVFDDPELAEVENTFGVVRF